jgi:hypothetical protein
MRVLIAFAGTIAIMESQIETMRGSIAALKGSKPGKEKKKKEKRDKNAHAASGSKSSGKHSKPSSSKKKSKKPVADDDVLTFEQKKDLSEAIGKLDGLKLEKVIQIIHEGVPEIREVSLPFFYFSIVVRLIDKSRAPRKSNWRSISFQQQYSRSCTTSYCVRYGQQRSEAEQGRVLVLVG